MPAKNYARKGTFESYMDMKRRCYNQRCANYPNYGGRGIKVCDRWLESFNNFAVDMGIREKHLTLDRIDVNGDYEPSNCRWVDRTTQNNNQRRSRFITYNGQTKTLAQWVVDLGIKRTTIRCRIAAGMPIEQVMLAGQIPRRVQNPAAIMDALEKAGR